MTLDSDPGGEPSRWRGLVPRFEPGWVWLTGAGPGDPGLLTLQALHALEQADIIYFDALVSSDVLRLATPRAERVSVGKRGGTSSPRQSEITGRLVESARAGLRVLRLKGGDPMVFGRGAEEALALSEAGIPFRILPGVTSGIGGLAYAGIALTHRDFNQSVTFVTAHDATGELSASLDWKGLARSSPVIVFYMGYRLLGAIADRLMASGRAEAEPVAVVSSATTERQRTLISTIGTLARDVEAAGLDPPVLLVVGEIVRLRPALDWHDGWSELQVVARAARSA